MQESVVIIGVNNSLSVDLLESLQRLAVPVEAGVLLGETDWEMTLLPVVLQHDEVSALLADYPAVLPHHAPKPRAQAQIFAREKGFRRFPAIIDPTAIVASTSEVSRGAFVNAGAVVAGRCNIGEFALINRSASIGHHCHLEKFAVIGPGVVLASSCRIGEYSMVGAGAVLRPDIVIGPGSMVGAGAVVTKDVPAKTLVVGNPARAVEGENIDTANAAADPARAPKD